jgi:hypothetical protein
VINPCQRALGTASPVVMAIRWPRSSPPSTHTRARPPPQASLLAATRVLVSHQQQGRCVSIGRATPAIGTQTFKCVHARTAASSAPSTPISLDPPHPSVPCDSVGMVAWSLRRLHQRRPGRPHSHLRCHHRYLRRRQVQRANPAYARRSANRRSSASARLQAFGGRTAQQGGSAACLQRRQRNGQRTRRSR